MLIFVLLPTTGTRTRVNSEGHPPNAAPQKAHTLRLYSTSRHQSASEETEENNKSLKLLFSILEYL